MAQEWLNAVLTVEWLLGASMALAGKRLLTWVRQVAATLRETRTEVQKPADESVQESSGSE